MKRSALPFHKYADLTVFMKVVEGERPPRGAGFTKNLWEMLELCWMAQPSNRPSVEEVLQCLERASNFLELPSPGAGEGMDGGGDDRDLIPGSSGVLDKTSDTTTAEWSATSFGSDYLTGRSTPPSQINSHDGGAHQVNSTQLPNEPLVLMRNVSYRIRSAQ